MTTMSAVVPVRRRWHPNLPTNEGVSVLVLTVCACATVGTAPIEGYLVALQPQLAKLPAILLVLAWAWCRTVVQGKPNLHFVHVLLATLTAIVLASTAVHLAEPYSTEYLIRWIPFLVITAILVDVASAEVNIYALLASAVGGAAVAAGGALYSVLIDGERRATGPLEDPNDLAYVLMAALPLIIALNRPGWAWIVGRIFLVGLIAVAAAATLSRGGGFALGAALLWLAVRRAIKPRQLLAVGAAVLAIGAIAALAAGPLLASALSEKQYIAGSNIDTRLIRWQAAARMLAENPVLGVGPGGFRSEYTAASGLAEIAEQTPVTHNMYIEVGAELGVLGLLVFLAIIATAFVASEFALRGHVERRTVVAVQASLIAVLVASIFLSQEYYMSLWSMVAVACALHVRALRGRTV
jgi:putative inorganic carbon (hco3(-)) transporter